MNCDSVANRRERFGNAVPHRSLTRCVRLLASIGAGGVLLQAASGGCSQDLSNFVNTMGQDIVKGIGTGVTNLAEALVLNLFL